MRKRCRILWGMPPLCVFCQLNPGATKEHIYPKWVRKGIRATGPTTITSPRGVRNVTGLTWILRNSVCGECNNGWMATRLENKVKDYLLPAMRGWPVVLEPPMQQLIAAWAVKTALMFELKALQDGDRGLAPVSNLRWLYQHRDALIPPPGSQVWLAGVNAELGTANSHVGWHGAGVVDTVIDTEFYLVTFSVGYLVFQVFGTDFGEADNDAWTSTPRWSMVRADHLLEAIRLIWPARSEVVTWPPSLRLTIDDLSTLQKADDAQLIRARHVPIRIFGNSEGSD